MNKKTSILLILILFLLLLNSVNALHFNLNWIVPSTEPYVLEEGMDLNVQAQIECIKDGADPKGSKCQDVNATLYYCLFNGDVCGSPYELISQTGNLHLVDPAAKAKIVLREVVPGGISSNIGWVITWPDAIPGQRYNIIAAIDSNNMPDKNMDANLWVALIETNSLAGDNTAPYVDGVDDTKTELIINLLDPPKITWCKFADNKSFIDWVACDDKQAGTVACDFGDLIEGNYTYYYACQENITWTMNEKHSVDFEINFTEGMTVTISKPTDGKEFVIGDNIDFRSLFVDNGFPYTVEWASNLDTDWKSTQENFFSNELSIGNHEITLTSFFEYRSGEDAPIQIIEKTDSVNITVIPIPADVFNIISFEVNNSTNPGKKITTEDEIEIKVKIKNETDNAECSQSKLTIINAETGKTVYYLEDPFVDKCVATLVPANGILEKTYSVNLNSEGITKDNYKIKFDVMELKKEQNKENNHTSTIISVFDPVREMTATELSVLIIPAILLAVLIILKKKEIKEFIDKKKTKK